MKTTARLLAHISGGRPGYALRLMQDKESLAFRADRLEDLQSLLKSTRRERFAYAERLTDRKNEAKERFRETLLVWLSFWRDVMLGACRSRGSARQRGPQRGDRGAGGKDLAGRGAPAGGNGQKRPSKSWNATSMPACWRKCCCWIGRMNSTFFSTKTHEGSQREKTITGFVACSRSI